MNTENPTEPPLNSTQDPLRTLGLTIDATSEQIRARYLELIKQCPPERDPQRFQEIQRAFQFANDPLAYARALLESPSETPPKWSEVIEREKSNPPALSVDLLLSLGNRSEKHESSKQSSNNPR